MNKIKLLVLSCGTNACFNLIKEIRENYSDQIYVIGLDINKPCDVATASFVDEFYQTFPTKSPEFVDQLKEIICRTQPRYILPSFDEDQLLMTETFLSSFSHKISSLGCQTHAMEIYKDKVVMQNFLKKQDFPVPRMFALNELKLSQEYFVKPVRGVGSRGTKKMLGKEIIELDEGKDLVQEVCKEPEVTVECFKFKNFFSCISRKRLETKAGVCTKAEFINDPVLKKIAERFSKIPGVPRAFNLQFMKNSEGRWVITDVNLRLAGGGYLSKALGWDVYSAYASSLLKNGTSFSSFFKIYNNRCTVLAIPCGLVTSVKRFKISFDLDGTLLNSLPRHEMVLDDVLKERHINLCIKNFLNEKRQGKSTSLFLLENGIFDPLNEELVESWCKRIEQSSYLESDVLYLGVSSLLLELTKTCELELITARNDKQAVLKQLKDLGIIGFFSDVHVVDPKETIKCKSEILASNSSDLYIGDTEADYEAARTAAVDFIAVNYGIRHASFLTRKGVDSVSSVEELFCQIKKKLND